MIRSVLGSRASIGGVLGSGRGGAAAAWYLSGGVSAANCVAAYQPIRAVSLAASYVNLANPGTFDAAPGTAPAFDTATGWTFDAASSQYLTTGITPASGYSMIVRFSDISNANSIIGQFTNNARFFISPNQSGIVVYGSGQFVTTSPGITSGVLAIAGQQGYRNGTADGASIGTWTTTASYAIILGARNLVPINYGAGKIQAAAIYNTTLTAPQVAAISAAMAAL